MSVSENEGINVVVNFDGPPEAMVAAMMAQAAAIDALGLSVVDGKVCQTYEEG